MDLKAKVKSNKDTQVVWFQLNSRQPKYPYLKYVILIVLNLMNQETLLRVLSGYMSLESTNPSGLWGQETTFND